VVSSTPRPSRAAAEVLGVIEAVPGGFVPIRTDLPELLGQPVGRREGHYLAALGIAVRHAEEADWRSDTIAPYRVTAWADAHRHSYRRCRRALTSLSRAGVATVELHPFRPGRAFITPRTESGSLLHSSTRTDETFVPLARGALSALEVEHSLSWAATDLLVSLLLFCDRRGDLAEGEWTKSRLSARLGVGWQQLTRALEELAHAGLLAYEVRRGAPMTLRLLARPALVVATSTQTPKRHERRKILREARVGAAGQASECAEQILRHYQLAARPSPALLSAIGDGLAGGLGASTLVERVVASGRLGDARDPLAVITHRTRRVADELASAREDDQRRREAAAAEKRTLAQRRAEEEESSLRFAEESRWLASVLDVLPSGEDLGLTPLLWSRPAPVEASILSTFRDVVSLWPDLSPEDLAGRWATSLCAGSELDVEGLPRQSTQPTEIPGTLPRLRAGPTLAERLAAER